jgi:hypothetical protein
MDVVNNTVNADANIFGLCDKQLARAICHIDLKSRFHKLLPHSEEELDVLLSTRNYQ